MRPPKKEVRVALIPSRVLPMLYDALSEACSKLRRDIMLAVCAMYLGWRASTLVQLTPRHFRWVGERKCWAITEPPGKTTSSSSKEAREVELSWGHLGLKGLDFTAAMFAVLDEG